MFFKNNHRYHWTAHGTRFRPGWVGGRDNLTGLTDSITKDRNIQYRDKMSYHHKQLWILADGCTSECSRYE
ncbi:hypothetical protein HanRHA438_Chr07g0294381 [Helianthus annuus]|nr:hypothetical protein HanRHA438_Chr07g0294381 [Helianthus annuus]